MQDATTRSELHSLHSSGDLPPINCEPTQPLANKPAEHGEPTETFKGEPPVGGTPSPLRLSGPLSQQHDFPPQWGLYYAVIAGVIAGAIFSLITFLVSLIPSYPGNFEVNGTTLTTGSLVISCLLLCLWSIGVGLVSLFGTWVATVRHPHYLRLGG
jgi:hypothetical protein